MTDHGSGRVVTEASPPALGRLVGSAFVEVAWRDPPAIWVESVAGVRWSRRQVCSAAMELAERLELVTPPDAVIALSDPYDLDYVVAFVAAAIAGRVVVPAPCGSRVTDDDLTRVGITHQLRAGAVVSVPRASPTRWTAQLDGGFALVVFTSGTTGSARPVVVDDASLVWATWNAAAAAGAAFGPVTVPADAGAARAAVVAVEAPAVFVTTVGPDAIGGVVTLCKTLLGGGSLIIGPGLGVEVAAALVADSRVDALSMTTYDARRLLRMAPPAPGGRPVAAVTFGGAWVPSSVAAGVAERFGCVVASGYGATELGGVAAFGFMTPDSPDGFIGAPLPSCEVDVAPGELGPLSCVSPAAAAGAVSAAGELVPFGRWVATGDVVERAADGTMRVLGRADDVILRAGRRIDPVSVEATLEDHPGVAGALLVPVASKVAGEVDLLACCVGRDGPVGDADLRRWMVERVPAWAVPRRFEWVDALPRTHDGALRRRHVVLGGVG